MLTKMIAGKGRGASDRAFCVHPALFSNNIPRQLVTYKIIPCTSKFVGSATVLGHDARTPVKVEDVDDQQRTPVSLRVSLLIGAILIS